MTHVYGTWGSVVHFCILADMLHFGRGGSPLDPPKTGGPLWDPPPQTPPSPFTYLFLLITPREYPPSILRADLGPSSCFGGFHAASGFTCTVPEFQSLKNSRNCPHGTKALGGCRNHPHPRCPHRRVAPLSAVLCGADDAITLPPGSCLSGGGRGAFNQDQLIGLRCSGLVSQSLCSLLLQRKAPMTCH